MAHLPLFAMRGQTGCHLGSLKGPQVLLQLVSILLLLECKRGLIISSMLVTFQDLHLVASPIFSSQSSIMLSSSFFALLVLDIIVLALRAHPS
jgi:hypothetical protein